MIHETGSILGVGNVDDAGKCAAGAELAMEQEALSMRTDITGYR